MGSNDMLDRVLEENIPYVEGGLGTDRPRYEYKSLWRVGLIEGLTLNTLNMLGEQGWHVVAEQGNWLILERPKLWEHNWYLSCCHGRPCCKSCLSNCSAARETE